MKVNGKRVKEDLTCEKGDLIEVYTRPAPVKVLPVPVYQDDNIAVFNKPCGITSEDFFSEVRALIPSARAVHRLDRNTRGITVFALNAAAEVELLAGFKSRAFKKLYVTEVVGVPERSEATLVGYLIKDAEKGEVTVYSERRAGAVEIKTHYRVLKSSGGISALEVELLTGRTHQIRAHLAHAGYPIVGDGKYGNFEYNRKIGERHQRLQAFSLTLAFDGGSPLGYLSGVEFSLPKEFGDI